MGFSHLPIKVTWGKHVFKLIFLGGGVAYHFS